MFATLCLQPSVVRDGNLPRPAPPDPRPGEVSGIFRGSGIKKKKFGGGAGTVLYTPAPIPENLLRKH